MINDVSLSQIKRNVITAHKRSLGQGNVFTPVCHSVHGGRRGWLPSMHHRSHDQHPGGVLPTEEWSVYKGGFCLRGGLPTSRGGEGGVGQIPPPPRTRKVGGTYPTGMLSC